MAIVNEIDCFLEEHGAKQDLADVSERVLRSGIEPEMAFDLYLGRYFVLIDRCRILYPEVIRRYYTGEKSLEGRLAKDQNVGAAMNKERKLDLLRVYQDRVQTVPGFDSAMIDSINHAYRSRHEAWGKAPNRLLAEVPGS